MKKLLSILATVGLTATASTAVVSCGTAATSISPNGNGGNKPDQVTKATFEGKSAHMSQSQYEKTTDWTASFEINRGSEPIEDKDVTSKIDAYIGSNLDTVNDDTKINNDSKEIFHADIADNHLVITFTDSNWKKINIKNNLVIATHFDNADNIENANLSIAPSYEPILSSATISNDTITITGNNLLRGSTPKTISDPGHSSEISIPGLTGPNDGHINPGINNIVITPTTITLAITDKVTAKPGDTIHIEFEYLSEDPFLYVTLS